MKFPAGCSSLYDDGKGATVWGCYSSNPWEVTHFGPGTKLTGSEESTWFREIRNPFVSFGKTLDRFLEESCVLLVFLQRSMCLPSLLHSLFVSICPSRPPSLPSPQCPIIYGNADTPKSLFLLRSGCAGPAAETAQNSRVLAALLAAISGRKCGDFRKKWNRGTLDHPPLFALCTLFLYIHPRFIST
jgi:hypothetical protein